MSEDEEVVDVMENGYVKSTHFEAHAYDFVSDEVSVTSRCKSLSVLLTMLIHVQLIAIRNAIDAIPDPNSANRTPRQRGSDKPGPPHVAHTVDTGMRTWMIKKKVLDAHLDEWLDQGRVYTSGAQWGEAEPSYMRSARKAIKRLRTDVLPGLELVRQADAGVLLAQQKMEDLSTHGICSVWGNFVTGACVL